MRTPHLKGLLLVALLSGCVEKPVLELQQAREAMAMASDAEADIYAPEQFQAAVLNLEGGEFAIEQEETRAAWSRNYDTSLDLLELAIEQSEEAILISTNIKEETFSEAQELLPQADQVVQFAYEEVERARLAQISRRQFDELDGNLRGAYDTSQLARESFDNGDYAAALAQAQQAIEDAEVVRSRARELVEMSEAGR